MSEEPCGQEDLADFPMIILTEEELERVAGALTWGTSSW